MAILVEILLGLAALLKALTLFGFWGVLVALLAVAVAALAKFLAPLLAFLFR